MRSPTRTPSRGGNDLIDDARTFTCIFEAEFRLRLFKYAFRYIGNRQEAEDVVSDTYIRVMRKVCDGGIRRVTLPTYLFRAARNRAIDYLRSNRSEEISLERVSHESWGQDAFREVIANEAIGCLLEFLPEDYRLPVLLCDLQDLPARDAAEVVGISVPALKSRLYRGRNALRGLMVREGIVPVHYLDMLPVRSAKKRSYQPNGSVKTGKAQEPGSVVVWRQVPGANRPPAPDRCPRMNPQAIAALEEADRNSVRLELDRMPQPSSNGHLNGHFELPPHPEEVVTLQQKTKPRRTPVAKEFFGRKGLFESAEALASAILAQNDDLGTLKELNRLLFLASRKRRKRQSLGNKIRAIVIDLIFDLVDNDDRRARNWVRRLTAEFPPAADTPDHLYLH